MKRFTFLQIVATVLLASSVSFSANDPKKGEISMEKAQEITMNKINGKITSREYEFEKGQNVYSFDIVAKDVFLNVFKKASNQAILAFSKLVSFFACTLTEN
ncbi:MAG: PepSY domain-containing protein [Bdellovibrio sp.]|nr:PepSY domain-containing protein [Bdellovibrio sp.]